MDYAEQQLLRDREQAKENLISRMQLEQTQNAYATAMAQRDQAQAQASLAADQIKYTTLIADKAGVITSEQADTGRTSQRGKRSTTWPGAAISTW